MSVIHGANYGTPTLDLNFAENKSLIDTVSGQNFVTFSRPQANYRTTYVGSDGLIKYASANEPRFDHNPLTGECLGLLIEESRTNLITSSEILNPTYGGVFGISELNAAIAPNNTFTATKITQGSSGGWISPGAGTFTYSIFVKQGTSPTLSLIYAGYGSTDWSFTFATESLSVAGVWSNASVQKFPNGWYRLSATTNSRSLYYFYFSTSSSTTNALIWGLQIEAGSFPTSYIPTTGSQVIRSADQASITGTNFSRWYNPNSSTYYASVFSRATSKDNVAILGINGSDLERQVQFSANGGSLNSFQISTRVGGVYYLSSVSTISLGVPIKAAGIINGTEIKIGFNGTLGDSSSPPRIASSIPTTMDIGRFLADSQYSLNGTISRLTYYPTRLQDYQLQQITK